MALKSGFYNAMLTGGDYDRKYNANDYSNVFSAFLKDGVRRSGLDDFRVTFSDLTPTVKLGYAICGGRWVQLDADYVMNPIATPVGDYARIDAVVLRVDTREPVRAASIIYRVGTPASSPTAPGKDTTTGISELILATVEVEPYAATVKVTDTRPDANVCGWVTTPVGYDEYFTTLDSRFESWFEEKKDSLSSVTLFKRYKWRTVLADAAGYVLFDIPQYDPTGVDIIEVYVNGLLETEGADYTLSNNLITFTSGGGAVGTKIAGTEIVVYCYKSVDGTGLGSVSEELAEMQGQVAGLVKDTENNYICNGVNDNVLISELIAEFNAGTGDFEGMPSDCHLKINVYGSFGATAAFRGTGSSASPYTWFSVGGAEDSGKRVILDFSNCNKVYIQMAASTANTIFEGENVTVNGLDLVAACYHDGCGVSVFSGARNISANGCRFKVITTGAATLAYGGTFNDCEAYISSANDSAYCFYAKSANNPIFVSGGKYRAYTASTLATAYSAVAFIASWETDAVIFINGINCPTVAVSAFYQKYCFYVAEGTLVANGVCSALPNNNAGGTYTVNGLVSLSRP